MKRTSLALCGLLLGSTLTACGADKSAITGDDGGSQAGDMSTPPDLTIVRPALGTPLDKSVTKWTWVDFPDSSCDDGTPTGIGYSPGASNNVLVFLNGGGACWDYSTCFVLNTSSHGPFGKAEFNSLQISAAAASILGRDPNNPFHDWSLVYVPYCTGDVHAGKNVAMYMGYNAALKKTETRAFHHVGYSNLDGYLKRIAATWPTPDKVVLSGSSAGGFGAAMNYDNFRRYFAGAKESYLIDDSGPAMVGDAIPQGFKDDWYRSWGLANTLGLVCPNCQSDLSSVIPILAMRYPHDRMSLLEFLQDATIRSYFVLSPTTFEADVLDTASKVIDPIANFKYFYIPGETHTMLGDPSRYDSQNVNLWDWLKQEINDDPKWTSLKP